MVQSARLNQQDYPIWDITKVRSITCYARKMRTRFPKGTVNKQTIGNMGLYHVCYRLSRYGWNVMPTTRNARGIDIVAYNQPGSRVITIQVKSLSKRVGVPLGKSLDNLIADFVVICSNVGSDKPECSVMKPREVRRHVVRQEKDGVPSHWLPADIYQRKTFNEQWSRIGTGIRYGEKIR